jgi:hypothetical protein
LQPSIATPWLQAQDNTQRFIISCLFLTRKEEEEAEETLYRNNKVITIIIITNILLHILLNVLQKYYNSRGKMM